ncbi:MAG: hypothetical protein K2N82_06065 [Lachnospiraceae bacterium]|nr:hypothetical protein [Lachnospiraceae bacterium]
MSSTQNKIRKSMENIRATETMKQNTLRYLEAQRTRQNPSIYSRKPYTILRYAMTAICIFLLAGAGAYSLYNRPVSYISIDVNPSIEFAINRFDRVVSVKGYNTDGQNILQHVSLKNISYMQAIERLLQDTYYSQFLNQDSQLVVTVISEHADAMLEQIHESDSLQALGALTYSSDAACMNEAHKYEMSFGKYRAFLELSQYDTNVTVEDCHGMSMGEIQNRIKTCQGHSGKDATGGDNSSTEIHQNEHSKSHGHH